MLRVGRIQNLPLLNLSQFVLGLHDSMQEQHKLGQDLSRLSRDLGALRRLLAAAQPER